jgi:protein TonB
MVVSKVAPIYPAEAKASRIQGTVVVGAAVDKQGRVIDPYIASSASPPPLLNQAALDAVKQWRYRPYLLNGNPVEVETQITVHFTLASKGQ